MVTAVNSFQKEQKIFGNLKIAYLHFNSNNKIFPIKKQTET